MSLSGVSTCRHMYTCMDSFPGESVTTFPRGWESTHQLAECRQPHQGCQAWLSLQRGLVAMQGHTRTKHDQVQSRGRTKTEECNYFSNLLVLIVPETNTSRPGKNVAVHLPRLWAIHPKVKEKAEEQILGLFCLARWTLCPLHLEEGRMEDYLEPPIRRSSNSPFSFPQISFRSGNWPWLPRAETESSALKHFLCLVTMHGGISTNPLSCHGFRSSTWEKTAWDSPGPHPHPVWSVWLLDGAWRATYISLPYFPSWRIIQVWPGCRKRPGKLSGITKRLVSHFREGGSLKGGTGRTQAVEPTSLCVSGLHHFLAVSYWVLTWAPVSLGGRGEVPWCSFLKHSAQLAHGKNLINVICSSQPKGLLP